MSTRLTRRADPHQERLALALPVLTLGLGLLAYRSLLVWDPTEGQLPLLEGWMYLPSGTSPQFVLMLAVAALVSRRDRLRAVLGGSGSPGWALPFLALAALLFVWAHYVGAKDLLVVSLASLVLGAGLLRAGTRLARELVLPVLILLFAMPLPAVVTNQFLFPLQLATAEHTRTLVGALGVSAVQFGDLIHTSSFVVQVIETCSGMRSIDVLTLLALVYVAFFRPGTLRGTLLVLAAPAIAYAVNLGRVALMVLRPESPSTAGHLLEGVVWFGAAFALLLLTGGAISRLVPGGRSEPASSPADEPGGFGERRAFTALAGLLAMLVVASLLVPSWAPVAERGGIKLPQEAAGWRLAAPSPDVAGPDPARPWRLGATRHAYGRYERDGEIVMIFVATNDRLRRRRSLLSPRNAYPGDGWQSVEREVREATAEGSPIVATLLHGVAGRVLTYHWYEGTAGMAAEVARGLLATDRSPLRRPGSARLVRLHTEVEPTPEGRAEAEARLRSLVAAFATEPSVPEGSGSS